MILVLLSRLFFSFSSGGFSVQDAGGWALTQFIAKCLADIFLLLSFPTGRAE